MRGQSPTSDKLWPLLDSVFDDNLTETQVRELETLLTSAPTLRVLFAHHVQLRSNIRFLCRAERVCELGIAHVQAMRQLPSPCWPTPVGPLISTNFSPVAGWFSSGWPAAYLIATVVLCIGLLVGAITKVSSPVQTANQLPPKADQKLPFLPARQSVGRVTGMADCQFADQSTITFSGAYVSIGRRYALASGLMEITYDSGAKVILQGPCNYEVTSAESGHLSIGRLTARVGKRHRDGDKDGVGVVDEHLALNTHGSPGRPHLTSSHPLPSLSRPLFAISTPTATITDLGTEFGVEVDGSGVTTSHVFRGSVKISMPGSDGSGQNNNIILTEGEAARTELSGIRRCKSVESSRFARVVSPDRDEDAYSKLVLSLEPCVYYRMEPPKDGNDPKLLLDFASGKHHGIAHFLNGFTGDAYVAGRFGQAFHLRGPMVKDYATVSNYPLATNGRLSVSAWVLARGRLETPIIAISRGKPTGGYFGGQFMLCLDRNSGDLYAEVTQKTGYPVKIQEGSSHPFPLGLWQHVMLVVDGSNMRLYRNGQEVASGPCVGILFDPSKNHLVIGCRWDEKAESIHVFSSFWQGMIDELAIFNRALSADEVRLLFFDRSNIRNHQTHLQETHMQ